MTNEVEYEYEYEYKYKDYSFRQQLILFFKIKIITIEEAKNDKDSFYGKKESGC